MKLFEAIGEARKALAADPRIDLNMRYGRYEPVSAYAGDKAATQRAHAYNTLAAFHKPLIDINL